MRNLVLVLGDQLDGAASAFDGFDPRQDAIWMAEVAEESTHVWSSKPRTALFLSAMRHFHAAREMEGARVNYGSLEDPENTGEGEDAIGLRNSSNVWVHQSTFQRYGDGMVDMRDDSSKITVSWCKFNQHVKVMLVNAGPDLTLTSHHNYFYQTGKREPQLLRGEVQRLKRCELAGVDTAPPPPAMTADRRSGSGVPSAASPMPTASMRRAIWLTRSAP